MKHDVFLSYAREDLAVVQVLVGALEAEGLSVFWDRQIVPGQPWSDVLESALRECRAVVVLWSPASVNSTWVKAEATEAMSRNKLIPLRIDGAAIPMPFGQVQTAEIAPGRPLREQGVSIASAIAALAVGHTVAPATTTPAARAPAAGTASASHVVDWRHAFLAMEGRLGRRDYWICYLALVPISVLTVLLVESLLGASPKDAPFDVKQKAALCSFLITLYPRIAILLKRLHDFGWTGWWVLPMAMIGLLQAGTVPSLDSSVAAERHAAWFLCGVVWMIVVFVGARAGNPGVNRYGPPHGGR